MPHLLPDFGAGRALVGQRIRRITKLIHVKGTWNFFRESRGHVLVIFRMTSRHIRSRDAHLGSERFHVRDFFLRHLIRNHQQNAIALGTGNEGQTQASIACSGLYDRATGLQFPLLLRRFDHRERDPVLDRAAGVLIFKLKKKVTRARVELRHLHQRRVANERQNRGWLVLRNRRRFGRVTHEKLTR